MLFGVMGIIIVLRDGFGGPVHNFWGRSSSPPAVYLSTVRAWYGVCVLRYICTRYGTYW